MRVLHAGHAGRDVGEFGALAVVDDAYEKLDAVQSEGGGPFGPSAACFPSLALFDAFGTIACMAEAAPKRRWFAYSLRTIFALVTLVALGLGWHFSDANQRQMMRRFIEENRGTVVIDEHDDGDKAISDIAPWRRLLGDERADFIALPSDWTEVQVARAKKLFPEAQVLRMQRDWPARIDRRWRAGR